eukprot:Partr_v1_DN27096_c4_g1_i3_m28769 putative alanine aminotransferase
MSVSPQSQPTSNHPHKVLTRASINQHVVNAEYAVRGAIPSRAEDLRRQLHDKPGSLPFEQIISCNIGNPHQLQQSPITFYRQVASLVEYGHEMLDNPAYKEAVEKIYAPDAISRARALLDSSGGAIGAYSNSQGITAIREHVAQFIQARDGYPAHAQDIFLTAGASQGVAHLMQTMISGDKCGIMIPMPQYPLYTATLALCQGVPVPYYLLEEKGWTMPIEELERSLRDARAQGIEVRALCVINPGNPTGQCLKLEEMRKVVEFCARERLVLVADEVYQANIYSPVDKPFHSFKKVVMSMQAHIRDSVELVSFHSISKGVIGECGRRGGYFECTNIDSEVRQQLYKLTSISLCPSVQGQIMVDLMVKPPREGDFSYAQYRSECDGILESLKRRASKLRNAFSNMRNWSCQEAEGSMYLFPSIHLPQAALEAAKKANMQPDVFFCMELLNATGVCVVPGSGFGQKKDTFHLRSTFLPPEKEFDEFIARLADFNDKFMTRYDK